MKLKNSIKTILFLMLVSFAFSEASAQGIRDRARFTAKKKYWSVGGMATTANFWGDLSPSPSKASIDWSNTRFQFGGYVQKRLHPRISARVSLNNNLLAGSDKDAERNADRGLEFNTYAFQLNGMAIIDLFQNSGVFYRRPKVPIPYVGLGIGMLFSNAKVSQNSDPGYAGTQIGEDYIENSTTWVVPVAAGVRYKLTTHLDIAIEVTANYTGSDRVDGIDNSVNSSPLNELNDAFLTMGFHINYILGGAIKMPKFR